MNRYKKLISDTMLMTIGSLSSKVLVFLLLPVYTYVLSKEEYGIADLFTTTISMLIPILTLSISEATFRFAFDKEMNQNKNLMCSLVIIVGSCIVLVPLTGILSIWNEYFGIYSLYFICLYSSNAFHTCLINYARGTDHIKIFVSASIIYTAILVAMNIIFLTVIKIGLLGYLLAMILAFSGSSLFIFLVLKGWKAFQKENFDLLLCRRMLKFSVPLIFSTTAWWAMNSVDKYMIIGFYGIGASGMYGVAQKIPTIISVFSSIFVQAWQISAINAHGEKDSDEFYTNVYKAYEVGLYIVAAVIIILTKPLATIMFQKEYFNAYIFAPILILSGVFSCLASFLQTPFMAVKKSGVLLQSTLAGVIVNIIANYILLNKMGTIGAAYATMIGFIVTWAVRILSSRKFVVIKINWIKTYMTLAVLFMEALVVTYDIANSIFYSVILTVIVLLINIKIVFMLFKSIVDLLVKK